MKGLFPAAEETLLLDVLSNADNNVQKASEKLASMGFEKRDTPPPRLLQRRKDEEQRALLEKQRMTVTPTPPPRLKSADEKLKSKYFSHLGTILFDLTCSEKTPSRALSRNS
jgi:hypothetical protein